MDKNLPLYKLVITEEEDGAEEVDYVALVEYPAIQRNFIAFNEDFVEPTKGEKKDEFLPRCISYVVGEGKETDQAVAICNSLWEQHFAEDSYTDYPKQASENAKIALRWAEENGWGECGTPVGKKRANDLANGRPVSRDTIARMSAFERHRQNSQKELGDGCGRLMWLAWGGDAGIEWASRKLKEIDKFEGNKVSFDYDDTLSTDRGKKLAEQHIKDGDIVYIISARNELTGMIQTATDLGIPESRVYATGSNSAKVEKVKELGITKHYDNNADVISELGDVGVKFSLSFTFSVQSEDERIVSGPLMIADMPIYRRDAEGEYYVVFTKEEIKKIVQRFFKKGYQSKVNLEHEKSVDGVYMYESYIVDRGKGILPMKGFEGIADGSWFGSFKVDNEDIWKEVKAGTFKGFSVEGLFKYERTNNVVTEDEVVMSKIINILSQIEH